MASMRCVVRGVSVALIACAPALGAQGNPGRQGGAAAQRPAGDSAARPTTARATRDSVRDEAPAISHNAVRLASGESIKYTVSTGMMPIRNEQSGEVEGQIFYVYYTKDGVSDIGTRPISFIFNGGPGSATVWLHMGAYGPKRVRQNADGTAPPPPYSFDDNPYTLLDQTDLVFLDPVGTGYSRATRPELGARFWGLDEDVRSVGEFIRLFLSRYERWGSPKFVSGESYGTTRAAHLSGWLADNGIALNGVMLLSSVLNFENSRPAPGNDIGYVGFLPSYAATAWYHKKVPADLQRLSIEDFVKQVEKFTVDEYVPALHKGASMTAQERQAIVAKVARFTGVSPEFVDENDLRILLPRFNVELLRSDKQVTGRLDSRFTTYNVDPGNGSPAFDPSEASIRNTFTPVLNDYVRRMLNYKNDNTYYILGGGIGPWRYEQGRFPNVVPSLERAFNKNPYMKLYVAMGYYDMATPFYAVEYTLDHMTVDPKVRAGIRRGYFTAGHMMYIDEPSMKKLRADLRSFIDDAIRTTGRTTTTTQ